MTMPLPGILFVCLGNVCRSPMAECVAISMLDARWPAEAPRVGSCGTAAFNVGKPADPRTVAALQAHGYAPRPHAARQISDQDWEDFTQIVAMDRSNLRTLEAWAPRRFSGRIRLLPGPRGSHIEVPDPFYGNAPQFAQVLGQIERGVAQLLEEIRAAGP